MSPLDLQSKVAGKPTIAGQVEAQLRHDILHGNLAPGAKLKSRQASSDHECWVVPLA